MKVWNYCREYKCWKIVHLTKNWKLLQSFLFSIAQGYSFVRSLLVYIFLYWDGEKIKFFRCLKSLASRRTDWKMDGRTENTRSYNYRCWGSCCFSQEFHHKWQFVKKCITSHLISLSQSERQSDSLLLLLMRFIIDLQNIQNPHTGNHFIRDSHLLVSLNWTRHAWWLPWTCTGTAR